MQYISPSGLFSYCPYLSAFSYDNKNKSTNSGEGKPSFPLGFWRFGSESFGLVEGTEQAVYRELSILALLLSGHVTLAFLLSVLHSPAANAVPPPTRHSLCVLRNIYLRALLVMYSTTPWVVM